MTSQNADREIGDPLGAAVESNALTACTPRAFCIPEFCRRYEIGRTNAYQEISAGRLRAVKAGRRTLITSEAAEAWLASLPELNSQVPRSRSAK